MSSSRRIFLSVLPALIFGIIFSPPGGGRAEEPAGQKPFSLEFREGMVTLRADGVPLEKVLEELSRRAGFELFLYVSAGESVTEDFRGLPLEEALSRLLPGYGFLFRPSREGELGLRAVAVLPSGPAGEGARSRFGFHPVARIAYGSGPGQAGRLALPEMERQGPQSFAPGPGGEGKDTIPVSVERLASVAFLGAARSGDIYLQVEQVRPGGVGVDLGVLVLNPAGIMVDKIEFIPNPYANWTSRLLQVDSRGDVCQMLPSPEAVELNRWCRKMEEARRK